MVEEEELLDFLKKLEKKRVNRDYITLIELLTKARIENPDWTDEEVRGVLKRLKIRGRIRITGNFEIRVRY